MPADVDHVWARSTWGVPPMTCCAILGPVLPLGASARRHGEPARRRGATPCPTCEHLAGCVADECPVCLVQARRRAAVAAADAEHRAEIARVVTVRLVYEADSPALFGRPAEVAPDVPVDPVAPVGVGNPEPVEVVTDRGGVAGYRFHLVDGFAPNRAAKPVRKALHALRSQLRQTFTVTVGGASGRCINVAPDVRDLDEQQWAVVVDTVRGQLGAALAAETPAGGRHVELIPF